MKIKSCVIFTTALCNLDCKYCYICKDKNGGLAEIDKDIETFIENGECLQQVLNYGDDIENSLENICLWGGEPVLYLERFTNQIDKWFKAFPNVKNFMISTNLTVDNEIEKLTDLFAAIATYGPNKYEFSLQVSIDGYPEMNDSGRGEGTTAKFLANYKKLLSIPYDKNKIELRVSTKPTLSRETFCYLDTFEKCKQWADFFNTEMFEPYKQAKYPFDLQLSVFNCAQPTEWTKEDGYKLAEIMRNLNQLNPQDYEGFNFLHSFNPIGQRLIDNYLSGMDVSKPRCGGICGSFVSEIIPIPHNRYTACHRGLFDSYVEYCNNIDKRDYMNGLSKSFFAPKDRSHWIVDLDEFKLMHTTLEKIAECPSQFIYTDYLVLIREYARQGIIDNKYMNVAEVKKTLPYFLSNSYCMQDSYIQTGSWTTQPTFEIPLFYNGAMDEALNALSDYIERINRI